MQKIWSQSDIARQVGISRVAVWKRVQKGHLPAPLYESISGTHYWSEAQARRIIRNWRHDPRRKRGQG